MENYYIHNRETGKLELHFEKDTYTALTDGQRSQIKSAFLWGRKSGCWISRCKEPNLWHAERLARELGLEDGGETGERLSFAEQQERKAERAERRAERFEIKADAAQAKGEALQKPINDMHGDIAFFTQPNINTSAGRAFTRQRDRMLAAYDAGFEQFNKSEYYRNRAASAQATADRKELKDRAFLNRRIEECKASLRKMRRNLTECEEAMPKAQAGTLKNWSGDSVTPEKIQNRIDHWTDRIEQELDKLGYYQDAMDALGGVQFSKENIKPGYIIQIGRYRNHDMTVLSCGPKTFTASGFDGLALKYPYAEITKIVSAQEATPMVQPFKVGETFTVREKVYTIVKATAKTVTLQTEGEAPARTTPKYMPIPAQGKFMWRLAVGSGWCYDYFYRD